jgi:hypothetical protein
MSEYDDMDSDQLLSADLAGIPSEPITDPNGVHIVNWRRLSDEGATTEWVWLRRWVEWFTVRYGIPVSVVPNCWYRHEALVEELSALHTAHLAAFDSSDTGIGPISWHERLATALPRLSRAGVGCSGSHQSTRPRSWVNAVDEQDWNAWVAETHAH